METANLDRIRHVTANYFFWQGLRLLPLGFVFVIGGLGFLLSAWDLFEWLPVEVIMFGSLLVAFALFQWVGTYYRRTFGEVRSTPGVHERRSTIKWFIVYPAMVLSMLLDWWLQGPIFISGFVWGAAIVAFWWSTGQGRHHYLIAAAALAALSVLPALGVVAPGKPMFGIFYLAVGMIYIAGGLLDHRELVRMLKPIREEDHDGSL